jgi:exodeoxyribonuclease V alpha subunit
MTNSFTSQAFAQTLMSVMRSTNAAGMPLAATDTRLGAVFERLWQSSANGDACIFLNTDERNLVLSDGAKILLGPEKPLMIDGDSLYLNRFWSAETRLALAVRLRVSKDQASAQASNEACSPLFPSASLAQTTLGLAESQLNAIRTALSARLTIIFGGPGTGKTRTIAALLSSYARIFERPIWVAAPTAKAGARLMESLEAHISESAIKEADNRADPLPRNQYLPLEALTIQRLLSRLPKKKSFYRDFDRPDVHWTGPGLLVVDEASMLSLELCEQLFERVSPDCALVLVGDPNQLHSVETGSVFAALCEAEWSPLKAVRVRLSQNFRQKNRHQLSTLAEELLEGQVDPAIFSQELRLSAFAMGVLVESAAQRYASLFLETQKQFPECASLSDRASAYLKAASRYRLLSARRSGFAGADSLSLEVLERLKLSLKVRRQTWFEGRMITITKNDPATGLFNGDIGVCVIDTGASNSDDASGTQFAQGRVEPHRRVVVAFERQGKLVTVPFAALPAFKDAYCLSVHQSQGSEFEQVDFVAAPAQHRLASRELLYTAVTRAKNELTIWGELADLQWAATHPTVRQSQLAWRINQHPTSLAGEA